MRIWDATTGGPTRVLRGHNDGVNTLAFSPRMAGGSCRPPGIRPCESGTRSPATRRSRSATIRSCLALAFSQDGQQMASGGYVQGDPGLRVWNATPLADDDWPEPVASSPILRRRVNGLAFSPEWGPARLGRRRPDRPGARCGHRPDTALPGRPGRVSTPWPSILSRSTSPPAMIMASSSVWDLRTGRDVFNRRVTPSMSCLDAEL